MSELTREESTTKVAQPETKQRRSGIVALVSDNGGMSVYGIERFPITLSYEQWVRLLDKSQELRKFLEENKSKLKLKE
jgi:hypothetical protein